MIIKDMQYVTGVFMIVCMVNITSVVFADDLTINQANLNLVERITKLEEGQKSIVNEMRTRIKLLEKNIDSRFESLIREMNQRFEAIDKRFEAIDKRFDLLADQTNKRLDLLTEQNNKRFDALENHDNFQGNLSLVIFAAIISLIGYIIWDRKTYLEKMERLFQSRIENDHTPEPVASKEKEPSVAVDANNQKPAAQLIKEGFTIPEHMQEKFRDLVNFMYQFPEMRPVLHAA